MTIREIQKNENIENSLFEVNKNGKTFANNGDVKQLYRIVNGNKVEYIEKTSIMESKI